MKQPASNAYSVSILYQRMMKSAIQKTRKTDNSQSFYNPATADPATKKKGKLSHRGKRACKVSYFDLELEEDPVFA